MIGCGGRFSRGRKTMRLCSRTQTPKPSQGSVAAPGPVSRLAAVRRRTDSASERPMTDVRAGVVRVGASVWLLVRTPDVELPIPCGLSIENGSVLGFRRLKLPIRKTYDLRYLCPDSSLPFKPFASRKLSTVLKALRKSGLPENESGLTGPIVIKEYWRLLASNAECGSRNSW